MENFIRGVEGWMVGPDGDSDYCPVCWPIYIGQLPVEIQEVAKQDSRPLANREQAQARCKCSDGWFVGCEMCGVHVSEPKNPESKKGATPI